MYSHQCLGTNSFPDVDFYHNQSPSRSPSRAHNTNAYQQSPSRVRNTGHGLANSSYAPAPILHSSTTFSAGHTPARSVSPEPWEAATSEFQVPAYRHEMPVFHYESQFSVNSVHDSQRDTGPWVYNPEDERDARGPGKRQASRSSRAAVALHGAGAEGMEDAAGDSSTTRKMKPRTAEQKLRMAESAATRRANDKNHLSIIKGMLPPLAYGQEYNNRTALAGAIARFNEDEETIRALEQECSGLRHRMGEIEQELVSEKDQKGHLITQRDGSLIQCANAEASLENAKAAVAYHIAEHEKTKAALVNREAAYRSLEMAVSNHETGYSHTKARLAHEKAEHQNTKAALANTQAELTNAEAELSCHRADSRTTHATLQRTEEELRALRQRCGTTW
ncbi:hypothetical protein DENSPDRAFT_164368 [Dentipellis sp. KUC8613]|nr:hypothetical protein DENSPDRAFT_164368 [Dentipellis sp. KUC8613]